MNGRDDILHHRHYADVRRAFLEASTLPSWCYTSEAFYAREVERIFRRAWNFVGREDEVANPGDYLVLDMFGESIIVARAEDGAVHALANTCRHRGTRLLDGAGHCRAIVCPYHGWTYRHDGTLVGARGMEETARFDKREHGLVPLRLESWAGFLFVNFDENAEPLSDYLGDLPEKFASYNFENMVCVRRKAYDLDCNWKIYIENAMEDYHTPVVHRGSIGLQETIPEEARGNWDAIHMASERTIAVLPGEEAPFPHIPSLEGKPAQGTYFTVIYPGTFFGTTQDCMWWLQQLPSGPARTKVVIGSCFPRETMARPDFEQVAERYYHRWDTSLPEDNAISERQQAGLALASSRSGRLSVHEPIVHAIANWVLDRVLD